MEILTPEERYKAQWCRSFLQCPESFTDDEILEKVSGTEVEEYFERDFKKRKAVFEFKKAIKETFPNWLLKLLRVNR
ncbi:MAG: hypothetical protein ABFQ95_07340 [Pseudomonadota bacterium]